MKRKQINFFATRLDLEALLKAAHEVRKIYFVRSGLFESSVQDCRITLLDSKLGIAATGDSNHEDTHLIVDSGALVATRSVPQHGGGVKYAVDQQINPHAIAFRPGGVYGEHVIVAGYIGTISQDAASLALFKLFSNEINKQFSKVKSYHVGKQAYERLENGWRLTSSAKSSPIYDLKK